MQFEGTQPEARDMTVENELVAGESETLGQTSAPHQTIVGQAPDREAPTKGETPDREPNEETTSGAASSPQPPSESINADQYVVETTLAESLSPSSEELAIGDLKAGNEEGLHRVSPVETEAMEIALTAREDIPEDLVWQAPSALEQPAGESAADQSPAASSPGSSGGGDVADITPLATKRLTDTTAASPLTLVLGGFLLLCGFLVFGAARKQRES